MFICPRWSVLGAIIIPRSGSSSGILIVIISKFTSHRPTQETSVASVSSLIPYRSREREGRELSKSSDRSINLCEDEDRTSMKDSEGTSELHRKTSVACGTKADMYIDSYLLRADHHGREHGGTSVQAPWQQHLRDSGRQDPTFGTLSHQRRFRPIRGAKRC